MVAPATRSRAVPIEVLGTPKGGVPAGVTDEHAKEAMRRLAREVGQDQFDRYFLGQTHFAMRNGELVVTVAYGFLAQLLERRFAPQLRSATGAGSVRFVIDRTLFETNSEKQREQAEHASRTRIKATPVGASAQAWSGHTLDDYIVGDANRLAHAAVVQALTMRPAAPVFVHSVCGMGKTHLLQGAVRRYQTQHPGAKVRCVSAETFTNEYIAAVKAGKLEQFRAQSRGVELLALDDVHFVAGKEATQNELLHTLDAIGLHQARVLLASDEHPRAIKDFSSKLASRCMAGAVVRIDAPDPAMRRALIQSLSVRRGLSLSPQACELIAMRSEQAIGSLGGFGGSVRELEGLLNSVQAVSRVFVGGGKGPVDEALVRRALGIDHVAQQSAGLPGVRRPIPVSAIIDHVCEQLAVERTQFAGKGRHKRVVLARAIVAHLARELTTQSFPEIARAMGRGNHSTVITAQRRLQRQLSGTSDEILSSDLSPVHPGVKLGEFIRTLSAQVRQSVR